MAFEVVVFLNPFDSDHGSCEFVLRDHYFINAALLNPVEYLVLVQLVSEALLGQQRRHNFNSAAPSVEVKRAGLIYLIHKLKRIKRQL